MRNKGISPLIATVLLIGFTLVMAFFVSKWGFKITTSTLDTVEGYATQSLYCDEVSIDIYCDEINKKMKNRGAFKISKIIVRKFVDGEISISEKEINNWLPNIEIDLPLGISDKDEVIPIVFDDKKSKDIACLDKKVEVLGC
ncbi:hypothetical protein CL618_00805 [archaeon]|nr:hypothetical protein [archaeon]|tara:strand:- start:442 stop:867 length:426 start_codon:yes stop_codon:yes gene_type:complete